MQISDYFKPKNIHEAYALLQQDPNNIIIGGGAWLHLSNKHIHTAIDLVNCGLDTIKVTDDRIVIGANVVLRQIETNPIFQSLFEGILVKSISQIMGIGLRNFATIGGSIAGKFAFSDILTPLLVMDVSLSFYVQKDIKLVDYLNQSKHERDILTHITIKREKGQGYFKKVRKTALDFAVLNIAVSKIEKTYRIAIGARPGVAMRLPLTEHALNQEKDINQVIDIMTHEVVLSTNHLASKEYRMALAEAYLKRALKEVK